MPATTLAQKMKFKPGQRAAVVNAPEGYLKELGLLPASVVVAEKLAS